MILTTNLNDDAYSFAGEVLTVNVTMELTDLNTLRLLQTGGSIPSILLFTGSGSTDYTLSMIPGQTLPSMTRRVEGGRDIISFVQSHTVSEDEIGTPLEFSFNLSDGTRNVVSNLTSNYLPPSIPLIPYPNDAPKERFRLCKIVLCVREFEYTEYIWERRLVGGEWMNMMIEGNVLEMCFDRDLNGSEYRVTMRDFGTPKRYETTTTRVYTLHIFRGNRYC